MCFSARVEQDLRELADRFHAVVAWERFADLFIRRAAGESIKLSRALERNYSNPASPLDVRTRAAIDDYRSKTASRWESEIFEQKRRLAEAEESLKFKETKRAREDVRIASKKVPDLLRKLADLRRKEPGQNDGRIFPLSYAPVIVQREGRNEIVPMRYTCRLSGKPASYDQRFPGIYNARRDNLNGFWKQVYGQHHAVMVISRFFENVPLHLYEDRDLQPGEASKNIILQFTPQPDTEMLVACLWDRWTGPGAHDLYSFAAITDDPPEEIAATGHQRCVIALNEENLGEWLSPAEVSRDRLNAILSDKARFYYEHRLAA